MSDSTQRDPRSRKFPDRKLGSAWYEWDGDVLTHESSLSEGPALYLVLLFLLLCGVTQLLSLDAWFLTQFIFEESPLAQLLVVALIGAPLMVWWFAFAICVLVVVYPRTWLAFPWFSRWLTLQVPFLAFCARPFGLSRDRIGSSCIALTNRFAKLQMQKASLVRPMVLLPRCLSPETIKAVRALAGPYDCPVAVAANNRIARERIKENRPSVLVAVACERDLVSGLFDFGHKLPILVLPNQRPHGPCLRATIDLDVLESCLQKVHELAREKNKKSKSAEVSERQEPA